MSKDIHVNRIVRLKEQSRQIVKEILDFGITESQKIDVMFNICLTLENNDAMHEITNTLKKYITSINKEEDENNVIKKGDNKILIS